MRCSTGADGFEAWLDAQERMLRAWRLEATLDPAADPALLEKIEMHRRWLVDEKRDFLAASAQSSDVRRSP